jgi:hypothetical protein
LYYTSLKRSKAGDSPPCVVIGIEACYNEPN